MVLLEWGCAVVVCCCVAVLLYHRAVNVFARGFFCLYFSLVCTGNCVFRFTQTGCNRRCRWCFEVNTLVYFTPFGRNKWSASTSADAFCACAGLRS